MQTNNRLFSLLFVTFLLTGCEERFPVYASFCTQEKAPSLSCLRYPLVEPQDKLLLEEALGFKEDPACPYYLKLTKYKIGQCNNPVVKSTGSDFEGYVRLEILKGFTCYYKIQSDYKLDRDAAFKRVLEQTKIDLKLKK
ncbi:MAG: hypothetical protein IE918_09370 [Campylobacterales bacterium]|nr:hypothetical protein [Campylobacterales bacterium]